MSRPPRRKVVRSYQSEAGRAYGTRILKLECGHETAQPWRERQPIWKTAECRQCAKTVTPVIDDAVKSQ